MKEIKIQFDYLQGPLWKDRIDPITGNRSTGVALVDNDKAIQVLNDEAEKMYESLYSFDSEKGGCQFDTQKFERIKGQLLSLVQTIIDRLSFINDGTYKIVDLTSQTLK